MLRPYAGEYLVSPVPVHLDLNACSNGCWYCFANLNNPGRRVDLATLNAVIKSVLRREPPGASLVKMFLGRGFPVLASNTTDPFAKSNWPVFEPLWQALADAGVPVTIQTRGGGQACQALALARPTMVYVSITSDDDQVIKANEPGAPSFGQRLELLQACQQAGHHVVVGLNPFYLPWWDDPMAFVQWLADHGFGHVWLGNLHLNRFQVANLSPRLLERQGAAIAYALKRTPPDVAAIDSVIEQLGQAGINVFWGSNSEKGGFWAPYFGLGFPFFPTLEGFLDHLREVGGGQAVAFSFTYFDRWANVAPRFRASECKDYLNNFGRSIRNLGLEAKASSLGQVHAFLWQVLKFPSVLRHNDLYLGVEGRAMPVTDDERPIMVWAPGHGDELVLPLSAAKLHLIH